MGVYHFAGLGKSVGAITSAFSYLATVKQQGGWLAEKMFGKSGEPNEALETRGLVQALVLFTTPEIMEQNSREISDKYVDNPSGRLATNPAYPGKPVKDLLKEILKKELLPIVRPNQPFDLYWCEYLRDNPLETFRRAVTVVQAAKPSGKTGKEVWLNLTGGSNIINSALQLANLLNSTPARTYYLITKDPRCIRHTVQPGSQEDNFWVDIPTIFLGFSPIHRAILEIVATHPDPGISYSQLIQELQGHHEFHTELGKEVYNENLLNLAYIRPLLQQELISKEVDHYQLGLKWEQIEQYLEALPRPGKIVYNSLSDIGETWFRHEQIK